MGGVHAETPVQTVCLEVPIEEVAGDAQCGERFPRKTQELTVAG
jgi:hypothetical protein